MHEWIHVRLPMLDPRSVFEREVEKNPGEGRKPLEKGKETERPDRGRARGGHGEMRSKRHLEGDHDRRHEGPGRHSTFLALQSSVWVLALIAGSHALYFSKKSSLRAQEAAELAASLHEARLKALSMQLQPHFLFNSLNSIAALMHEDVERADEMLVALADFLRMVLYGPTEGLVSLEEELKFLRRYVEIERIRFGDRLEYREEVSVGGLRCRVPLLFLQPLVENAFRHAFSKMSGRCELRIEAHPRDGGLLLRISDNGPGVGAEQAENLGLGNVRGRLSMLFGERAAFRVFNRGGCVVEIEIPCEKV